MKKTFALSLIMIAALSAPSFAANPVQAPKIIVVDRNGILTRSKVGMDISRQAQAFGNQAKADLTAQAKALEAQGQALSQQVAVLAPDVKAQKIKDFEAKQQALQALAGKKEQAIQYGVFVATNTVSNAIGPILKQIMQERGANLVLDKTAVVSGTDNSMDVTQIVVDRLNAQLSTVKVTPAAPPAAAAGK